MRRVLVIGCVVVLLAVAVSAWPAPRSQPQTEPVAVHFSDMAPAVYRHGRYRGESVRIAYPLRLTPTADPLVWEFRPGSAVLPPTHRLHFVAPPPPSAVAVVGTVDGIAPDNLVRLNNVPGVVVIRSARVVPRASP